MILPHGYDGQGPEHSSARLERFLQLCAENNIRVVVPSTAAQMFHILRHQALTNYIKPLVIFMSKKLRYKDAMSPIGDFTSGEFQRVIPDNTVKADKVKRVIVCSGQVYYDFYNERARLKLEDEVAIIRVEQFYPCPDDLLRQELRKYTSAQKFIWGQEEPYNQAGWLMIWENLEQAIDGMGKFTAATRPASAAPACGFGNIHTKQLADLLANAFK
jgi:2-oxoglutarate dehydrogenase E1 component